MKAAITLVIFLLMAGMVSAETQIISKNIELVSGSSESPGTALSFIDGLGDTDARKTYYFQGRNAFPDTVGAECGLNEYIVPIRCHIQWAQCKRVFDDDFLKTTWSDLVPISNWKEAAWYVQDEEYLPYDGYICKWADTPVFEESNGRFTSALSFDKTVTIGDTVSITGTYLVTRPGPFVLEAFVDTKSQTPLAVVTSSKSSCDSSLYWAGSEIIGVAGETYKFTFTIRAPLSEGKYTVIAHAWTDCYANGGNQVDQITSTIEVRGQYCQLQNAISAIGDKLAFWRPDSTILRDTALEYGCTQTEINDFCGTIDTDKDGIPNGCDFCPTVKGVPQSANGCHPCFGLDVYGAAGKECYKEFYEEYGIPERLLPLLNPVVSQKTTCIGNTVVTTNVREYGDIEEADRQNCLGEDVCTVLDNGGANCQTPEEEITEVKSAYECKSGDVYKTVYYSDGNKKSTQYEECNDGCQDGACTAEETCGGTNCEDGDDAIIPVDKECTQDWQCILGGEFCINGFCQKEEQDNWCETDENCAEGETCLGGLCNPPVEPECTVIEDCHELSITGVDCVDGYCIPTDFTCETVDDCEVGNVCIDGMCFFQDSICETEPDLPECDGFKECNEDQFITCPTGGRAMVSKCVDGQLIPTDKTCEGDQDGDGIIPPIDACLVADPPAYCGDDQGETSITLGIVILVILGAGGYIYAQKNKGPKRKKK